jgi:purine-binding chemotaxis protein CheW
MKRDKPAGQESATHVPEPDDRRADIAAVLHARAQALARRAEPAESGQTLEVLEFRLASERYAMETRYVRAVHPLRNLAPLPCTPAFVTGVVNLRGHIVPVLDLKKFFGLAEQGLTDLHRVIVVGDGDFEFGLLADIDVGMRTIPANRIQPAPPTLDGVGADYLKGVMPDGLVLLDMATILADPRILVDESPEGID